MKKKIDRKNCLLQTLNEKSIKVHEKKTIIIKKVVVVTNNTKPN